MKRFITLSAAIITAIVLTAFNTVNKKAPKNLVGAWELVSLNGEALSATQGKKGIRVFSTAYTTLTYYNLDKKEFEGTMGGPYRLEGNDFTETIDVNTWDNEIVGNSYGTTVKFSKGKKQVTMTRNIDGKETVEVWKRLDQGGTPLSGAWRITKRMREGEMRAMRRGPRKTIKILSGTRFQWCAMNTETKQFMGTGGGTYTFENGKYVENIEFFSRDGNRVGASLSFDGSVDGDDWNHSGLSSKGAPINEIWSREN